MVKSECSYFKNFDELFHVIQQHIFHGEFDSAKVKLNHITNSKSRNKERVEAFHLLGYIYKQEGDIEQTLIYWQKSNEYRKKAYPNDYQIAWNYALLSNYHYEKINTQLAVKYAISCLQLISGLTLIQQKEIKIFKIWNILGQSYKQTTDNLTVKQIEEKYKKAQAFIPDNSEYTSLPFSQQLGKNLQQENQAKVHFASNSTKRNFLKSNYSIVHLSGHGVIFGENMFNSYLVLSDSLLYFNDMTRFRNAAALMVLNTSNSANGKMHYGEGKSTT